MIMAPVSNIADTVNPWVFIGKYKRPYCILMLLKLGYLTFPAYLISDSYISFPVPSLNLYPTQLCLFITGLWLLIKSSLVTLGFTQCIQIIFSYMSSLAIVAAHQSLLLTNIPQIVYLSSWLSFPEGSEGSQHLESILNVFFQLQHNCYNFIQGCIIYHLCLHIN